MNWFAKTEKTIETPLSSDYGFLQRGSGKY